MDIEVMIPEVRRLKQIGKVVVFGVFMLLILMIVVLFRFEGVSASQQYQNVLEQQYKHQQAILRGLYPPWRMDEESAVAGN